MGYFDGLIGQEGLKRKMSFYLEAFSSTRRIPFFLFAGPKGYGKTEFMKRTAKHLTNFDGSERPTLEINCSVIKSNKVFFENIFMPLIMGNRVNIAFDEFHNCPNDFAQALLTICNSGTNPVREFQYDGAAYVFDFTKISMMFATTETNQIFPPLRDRMEVVDFEPYTQSELEAIITTHIPDVVFGDGVLETVAKHVRDNPRFCVKMADNILTFCKRAQKVIFEEKDWAEFCKFLNIMPFGLTSSEIMILRELEKRGACSLNMLASATGLSRQAIQREVEVFPLRKAFMRIDGQRKISPEGQKALAMVA